MMLVLFVCLISSPDTCREERLNLSFEEVSSTHCIFGAQPRIAQWSGENPDWRVARWKCSSPRVEGQKI